MTRSYRHRWFNNQNCSRFTFWRATPDTLWFYWNRNGRLVGYDKKTRQFIGSLGPEGFAQNCPSPGTILTRLKGLRRAPWSGPSTTPRTLYQPYPETSRDRCAFTVTNEPGNATALTARMIGGVQEVWMNGYDWNYIIVVTRCFVRLLTPDGKELWRAAYQPAYPEYTQVNVACLESKNQFALWIRPCLAGDMTKPAEAPLHVTWLDRNGGVVKGADLPDLSHPGEVGRSKSCSACPCPRLCL